MSEISTSNILPYRTRSSARSYSDSAPSSSSPDVADVPDVPVKEESGDELDKFYLRVSNLYTRQVEYCNNPGNREQKYSLMAEGNILIQKLKEFISQNSAKSKTIDEIRRWIELSCWNLRVSVFHQTVAVL